jgi:outer membrane protein
MIAMRMASCAAALPALAAAVCLATAEPVAAQTVGIDTGVVDTPDIDQPESASWRFRLGLGLAVVPDYIGSDDYVLAPLPQFTAFKGPQYVNVTGTYLFSNVIDSPNWRLGPTAKFINDRRCNAEDNRVNDQKCQSNAFMLGLTGGYAFDITGINNARAKLTPTLEVLGDVAGANDGVTIEPQLNFTQKLSESWRMGLRAFGTWGSDNYNTYYFGVTGRQSQDSGLSRHDADAGFYQTGLLGVFDYDISQNWRLSLIGRYARMLGDAEDSPMVDGAQARGSANQWLGGTVVSYAW